MTRVLIKFCHTFNVVHDFGDAKKKIHKCVYRLYITLKYTVSDRSSLFYYGLTLYSNSSKAMTSSDAGGRVKDHQMEHDV